MGLTIFMGTPPNVSSGGPYSGDFIRDIFLKGNIWKFKRKISLLTLPLGIVTLKVLPYGD